MAKKVRVSLANKCQLLFGTAVLLILSAALAVVWLRMDRLVLEGQEHAARQLAESQLNVLVLWQAHAQRAEDFRREFPNGARLHLIRRESFDQTSSLDPFAKQAVQYFKGRYDRDELAHPQNIDGLDYYRYARAIRLRDLRRRSKALGLDWPDDDVEAAAFVGPLPDKDFSLGEPETPSSALEALRAAHQLAHSLEMVLLIDLPNQEAEKQRMLNRIFLIAAGVVSGLLAIAVFWFITTRLILSPVRLLRNYAQQVSRGDLNIRSDISTGDEFEQLSDMFNTMLENLKSQSDQLRASNKTLDLKLGELAETNVSLYEANKIKGEFLANVSHELRTPLNSIIGFAEVLRDGVLEAKSDFDEAGRIKRGRYLGNIIESSRQLLELINDLLDLAKIEAGRMEVRVAPVNVADMLEGLVNLIRPQTERRGLELRIKAPPNLPMVHTDPGKVQQILFNFLSNAVKFSPDNGLVTVTASVQQSNAGVVSSLIRLGVADQGQGVAEEDQHRIFEKFTQLDPGVAREHGGTGLGLTISRDLARLLNGRIELVSQPGEGAMFTLIIPLSIESHADALMPDPASRRG